MKLHELKQKRNTIATDMRALHDKIGDGSWSEEQRTEWNEARAELDKLDAQIAREDELRNLDQTFIDDQKEEQRQNLDKENGNQPEEKRFQIFDKWMRHGASELSSEERKELRELRAQGVAPDEKGGYTVPDTFLAKVVEQMKAYGGIAGVAQILTTSDGRTMEWATADGTAEVGVLLGENEEAGEEDTDFGMDSLGALKMTSKIIRVSNELLQDSAIDMEAYLSRRIAERIGRGEARYLIQGTGAGTPKQPKGLAASVTGTTPTASATAVKWQEILALKHSIDPAYRRGPKFRLAFNDNTLKSISEIVDSQGRPLWLPDIVGVAPASVLNTPYVIDQEIDDIGAGKKFMYCGDFDRFIIRRVRYMILKRLVERYAEFDQTGFLAFHRFDCILEDTSAIKALVGKGSASS
ncbi:phage major capsid protein [Buttiauxella sp. B2]|uniref:phage major capsid protein n=1 Tax=Buttiauxella sp. B2 TaxID=2587812 RepID=UPI00111E3150|nr:phage major capsid protein [Buttiauxella sp. B2]TNV14909.1 phage major capsid protein [Buttiauxella sp. B2]